MTPQIESLPAPCDKTGSRANSQASAARSCIGWKQSYQNSSCDKADKLYCKTPAAMSNSPD